MADAIDFYFDFISPYGYVAAATIDGLGEKHALPVRWRAFNMRSVNVKILGLDKPLFQQPLKGPYFSQDVPRVMRYHGLPYNPGPILAFNPLPAMRAFWWLNDQDSDQARRFAARVFEAFFANAETPNAPERVAALAAEVGAHANTLLDYITSEEARARLRLETENAVAQGVWGTPTFKVEDQLFWGADRMGMLDDWLTRDGW